MKFTATGDYLVTRRISPGDRAAAQIQSLLSSADANITNLEMNFLDQPHAPAMLNGGFSMSTTSDRLKDLVAYGFNMVAMANNHSMDFGREGLEETLRHVVNAELAHAGVGESRAKALAPAYLDTPGGRVALISAVSTAYTAWQPGEQRADTIGRPGPNVFSYLYDIGVTEEDFAALQRIMDTTHLNNLFNLAVFNGFQEPLPDGYQLFGMDFFGRPFVFRRGEETVSTTVPQPKDEAAMERAIRSAASVADHVVVNLHGHEMSAEDNSLPPAFHETAARAWIDAGAAAVIIQGPHATRGIEIYRGRPIFYSLGDFIFQQDTVTQVSPEFYDAYSKDPDESLEQILARLRTNPNWLTNCIPVMTSVFAQWEMVDDVLSELTLFPIDLGVARPVSRNGFPTLSQDDTILDRVIDLSKPYGTSFEKFDYELPDGGNIRIAKAIL